MSKSSMNVTFSIVTVIFFNLIGYLTIGLPLAVLPLYVHTSLGFGIIVAGATISVQYLATFASRASAGGMCDSLGPKPTVLRGLVACGFSGFLLFLAGLVKGHAYFSLILILMSRLSLGIGESFVATGATMWGIGRAGIPHTAKVISWNGVATYTGLAIGAPLGIFLEREIGFIGLGLIISLVAWLSFPLAKITQPILPAGGESKSIHHVFRSVFSCGMGLALGTVGFASIATFITLFYDKHGWTNAALSLSAFGIVFVMMRLLLGHTINLYGGYRVAIVSFAVECMGLAILWMASSQGQAFLGSMVTALGFALIFPALGVEAVSRVSISNRGAALGLYSVFTDFALAVTGPLGGYVANRNGIESVFLLAAVAASIALVITTMVFSRSRHPQARRKAAEAFGRS